MPLAAAREAANCTCSPLIEILGRADITAVAGGAAARPRAVRPARWLAQSFSVAALPVSLSSASAPDSSPLMPSVSL